MRYGSRKALAVDPRESSLNPFFQPLHLLFPRFAHIPVWMNIDAQSWPAFEIPNLRLANLVRKTIDLRQHICDRHDIRPQLGPPVNVALEKIRAFKQSFIPGVIGIAPALFPTPAVG